MPEPPVSLVFEVSVTGPATGLPGLSIVALGGVLSIRRVATTTGAASVFPALSVATERKSYRPSATLVVSKEAEYGELLSLAIVVHEPPPAGRRSKATESTLEPSVSLALALNVIVGRRFAPGSVSAEVGAAVSDFVSFEDVATATLPALSATL